MPLTLTIEKLQAASVCRQGQVDFRRIFSRSHTWNDRDTFITDMADRCDTWNWDEAITKFGCDQEIWSSRVQELRDLANDDERDEDDVEYPSTTRGRQAYAWAEQYWDKMNAPLATSDVPKCARAYILAVDTLENATKFQRSPPPRSVTVEFGGSYVDKDQSMRKYLSAYVTAELRTLATQAVIKLTEQVILRKLELEGAIAAERLLTTQVAATQETPNATPAP